MIKLYLYLSSLIYLVRPLYFSLIQSQSCFTLFQWIHNTQSHLSFMEPASISLISSSLHNTVSENIIGASKMRNNYSFLLLIIFAPFLENFLCFYSYRYSNYCDSYSSSFFAIKGDGYRNSWQIDNYRKAFEKEAKSYYQILSKED